MPELTIDTFVLGPWMTNCYVAAAGESCWLIDAGFDPGPMIEHVRGRNLQPEAILLTHAHLDHIAGLEQVRQAWPELPIHIHPAERAFLTDPTLNLSVALGEPIRAPEATDTLEHGQQLELGGHAFEVRHTPGHSPGGVSFCCRDARVAIVGDALFAGSIGRIDFPTSDGAQLMRSIHEQLLTLPDHTRALPGHGPETTIGDERRSNPYLSGQGR